MQYQYCPNDPQQYATNLRRNAGTKNLIWDSAGSQEVLIVQTPFGKSPLKEMEKICAQLTRASPKPGQYTQVGIGVWACVVSMIEMAKNNGCPLNTEASTYSVFSCKKEGEVCQIYAPRDQAMISPFCDVPMEIKVWVRQQMREEGFFKKVQVPTGFFEIHLPREAASGYVDGDLGYESGGFKIPITKRMMEQGTIYIKTEKRPELISCNKGLILI